MSLGSSARRLGPACAAALILVAGCLPRSFLNSHPTQEFPEHYVTVAAVLKAGLEEAHVLAHKKVVGNEIRLIGKTKSEKVFTLYVEPAATKDKGDRASVTLYWDNGEDPTFWPLVVSIMKPSPAAGQEQGERTPAGTR